MKKNQGIDPDLQILADITNYGALSESEASDLQIRLSGSVEKVHDGSDIRLIAGVDTAFDEQTQDMFGAAVVVDVKSQKIVESKHAVGKVGFEYIPGLLSFREVPLVVQAYQKLSCEPDLLMCDGHGLIHPRRFGLACHLGLLLGVSSIGCGKTHLLGEYEEPDQNRGSFCDIVDRGETVGRFVRTRDGINPIFVSIGHKIDLEAATRLAVDMSFRFRIPEPVRQADIEVNRLRREAKSFMES